MATITPHRTDDRGRPLEVARIETASGLPIYLLPVETFPGHRNNLYLIDHPEHSLLFDVGSGRASADAELEQRVAEARRLGLSRGLGEISAAVLSHGHIDHFGGAHALRARGVPLLMHELDARMLEDFGDHFLSTARDVQRFLAQAGLDAAASESLLTLYRGVKDLFRDLAVDRRLVDGDTLGPGWRVHHVPGHCPGMVALEVDDVLLTADHLLSRITPVQRPQSLTPWTGLEVYVAALARVLHRTDLALGLGGHEAPIPRLADRVVETLAHHDRRLSDVLEACSGGEPPTLAELARRLFGEQSGYGVLLALCEAGAHVELLVDHGVLAIANLEETLDDPAIPGRYRARPRRPLPSLPALVERPAVPL